MRPKIVCFTEYYRTKQELEMYKEMEARIGITEEETSIHGKIIPGQRYYINELREQVEEYEMAHPIKLKFRWHTFIILLAISISIGLIISLLLKK